MTEALILAFDLGTTRLKVALFDLRGRLVAQVSRRNVDVHDGERSAQSADAWWTDAVTATRELMEHEGIRADHVAGISLSGRAGAAVFVDADGHVFVDPWSDTRHTAQLRRILDQAPGTPNYGATLLAKLLWLRENEPRMAARTRHVLYAKDLLLYRLTGTAITDPSSGPDGPWPVSLTDSLDIDPALLPRPAMPWTIAGTLLPRVAAELGLPASVPVAVGAHDGICANTGAGAIAPGPFVVTLGTHVVVRTVTRAVPSGSLRFYGYPPDQHVIGGNALMGGRALDWFADEWLDADESTRRATLATLDDQAARRPPGAGGISFLPYLGGQLSPVRRPWASATFHGLTTRSARIDMFRAVIEGVSFAAAEVFQQIKSWVGEPTALGMTGSGARSPLWRQMLADILRYPIEVTDAASEGRGAAIFCAVALGYYPTLSDAVANMVHRTAVIEPTNTNLYADAYERWRHVRDALAEIDKT